MNLPIFQIDAFADHLFSGNPAAVIPLDDWIDTRCMQQIAAENHLSETAFIVAKNSHYHIRWFTPEHEVALCGHATLAAAHVIFHELHHPEDTIHFDSLSGRLSVTKSAESNLLTLDFPSQPPQTCTLPAELRKAIQPLPQCCLKHTDYILVYENEEQVRGLHPTMELLRNIDLRGVIATAPSSSPDFDFVSRFFAPKIGIPEDPVTGSAHTQLTPYWTERLAKASLIGRQISMRSGTIHCTQVGDRVTLAGATQKFLSGTIHLP